MIFLMRLKSLKRKFTEVLKKLELKVYEVENCNINNNIKILKYFIHAWIVWRLTSVLLRCCWYGILIHMVISLKGQHFKEFFSL